MSTGEASGWRRQWYTTEALAAMLAGHPPGTQVRVTVRDPNGHQYRGHIISVDEDTSMVDVRTDAGMVIEGIRITWIMHAEVG